LEIDREWHAELIAYAKTKNVEFLSSPCDPEAVKQLADSGIAAFKLASFDLPDIQLITHMASFGVPLLVSTGMASLADIHHALTAAGEAGLNKAALLQCTSLYPAPSALANLRAIQTMRDCFGVPAGYSDHTEGEHVCLAAVALGACLLEKHVTLDRGMPGPDHPFAVEPAELSSLVAHVREVESSLGNGGKNGPAPEEDEMYQKGRRSLHVINAVQAGEIVARANLRVKRPGYGIEPRLIDDIAGLRVTRDIPDDHWTTWTDLQT
jgi:N-acetylneuraminate synthase/N,N'-diacetyllegionaminate synthase